MCFLDFGGSGGLWGRPWAKGLQKDRKDQFNRPEFGGHFRPLSPNSGHRNIDCLSDPAFSAQNRPRVPQSEHHSRSGAQKVANMEPKMMTFRGPAKKLKSEPGLRENPVEAIPGGPRIAQNSMLFLKALPGTHFSGPGGPKRRPRQILGQIGPILGPHLGPEMPPK